MSVSFKLRTVKKKTKVVDGVQVFDGYSINSVGRKRKIGKTAQSIIDILVSNPNATRTQICSILGKADGTIKEHLANLQARGIIERVGSDFGGHWKVLVKK